MTYIRKNNDKAFRWRSLDSIAVSQFQDFTQQEQRIEYQPNQVLEIQEYDGTCHIVERATKSVITYTCTGGGKYFSLPQDCPLARLWVRSVDEPNMWYKVPNQLKLDDNGRFLMLIPNGVANLVLCGDPYFDSVYTLSRA